MKKNMNLLCLVCSLIFSLVSTIHTQTITRIYTASLAVPKKASFEIINAQSLEYEMHGSMSSGGGEEGYIIRPGLNGEIPCLIIRNYQVKTWEKDSIRQEVKIEVMPNENSTKVANELLNNLKISIPQKRRDVYAIDGNMNLKKMELINGFFRKDRNTFILDNGKKYDVRQLLIESTLYIPKQSNVILNTDYVGLSLEDLEGQLSINAKYGYLNANNVKEIIGNIQNFDANFKEVEKMTINASYSTINASKVKELQIGAPELLTSKEHENGLFNKVHPSNAFSFSNKYRIEKIENLTILNSGSDQFNFGTITNFRATNSNFSNYYIKYIQHSFNINGKNGDITIYDVAPNFAQINIDNQISTVELNMKKLDNFKVKVASKEKTELRFAKYLVEDTTKLGGASNYFKGNKKSGGIVTIDCEYCEIIIN